MAALRIPPPLTHSPAELRELLARHGLEPRRALGQNFVADANTVRRIAALAEIGPADAVVEIGAGVGSLTLALAETGADVVAVEIDRALVPVLAEVTAAAGADNVRIVSGDAMTLDWDELLAGRDRWHLVANLPYNVGTQLVLDLISGVPAITEMLVMVQREVAERLAAAPGSPGCGIPSVVVALRGTAELVGRVPATVFHPRPRVESALVRIDRHPDPVTDVDLTAVEALARAAFGQRRKMLRRSLAGVVAADAFTRAGVPADARPEALDLEAWIRLTRAVES